MSSTPLPQLTVASKISLRTFLPPVTRTFAPLKLKVARGGSARGPRAERRLNGASRNGSNGRGNRSLDGSNDPDAELEASRCATGCDLSGNKRSLSSRTLALSSQTPWKGCGKELPAPRSYQGCLSPL